MFGVGCLEVGCPLGSDYRVCERLGGGVVTGGRALDCRVGAAPIRFRYDFYCKNSVFSLPARKIARLLLTR